MNRFDRALAILLLLRGGSPLTAAALAARFEVSTRTIYRDVETLGLIGVPVYAERGREGGIRLVEGYFLPPVTFTRDEAISLLLGLTVLRTLRARPFAAELDLAEQKLLAAMPARLRTVLREARRAIGSEQTPGDPFHPEPDEAALALDSADEGATVGLFLRAVLDRKMLALRYRSPYREQEVAAEIVPLGVFWDRGRWYLVSRKEGEERRRMWRADRVLELRPLPREVGGEAGFDIEQMLGRSWLGEAMRRWSRNAPVRIRITPAQAERLKRDWFYSHASFEPQPDGNLIMLFGEQDPAIVAGLVRWLGPEAELLEPQEWRSEIRAQLAAMLAAYENET